MRLLIDTCSFLWFIENNPKLSATALTLIKDGNNEVMLSTASLWEMAIKYSVGKLSLTDPFDKFIRDQLSVNNIEVLAVKIDHISIVSALPFHHRDPFDRMLIAQSTVERMPIVSSDTVFDAYKVKRLW